MKELRALRQFVSVVLQFLLMIWLFLVVFAGQLLHFSTTFAKRHEKRKRSP